MNNKIAWLILILIIVAAGSITAFNLYRHPSANQQTIETSAIMVKLSPQEITKQSDGVIVGTVKNLEIVKAPSNFRPGEEDIVTNAVITVEKYLYNPKSLSSSEITVQTIGGTIDNQTMTSEDSPNFEQGQRVVVFLRQEPNGTFIIYGGSQGKYTVNNGNVADNDKERDIFVSVFGKQMTLDEFENEITSIVSAPTPTD
jgi:hypothetical protein